MFEHSFSGNMHFKMRFQSTFRILLIVVCLYCCGANGKKKTSKCTDEFGFSLDDVVKHARENTLTQDDYCFLGCLLHHEFGIVDEDGQPDDRKFEQLIEHSGDKRISLVFECLWPKLGTVSNLCEAGSVWLECLTKQ